MKLSARNNLKAKIVEVTKGQTTRIDIGGSIVTASITNGGVAANAFGFLTFIQRARK